MIEYRVGDVFDRLAEIPDGSIDLVLTSPPFLALRSYLPPGHEHKHLEIGSEPDPATFIDTMLRLTVEWRRVLAPHGSICIELGDTYSGSGGAGGDYNADGLRDGAPVFKGSASKRGHWPLPKSLCGVPWLYALSLAYGRNLLNPKHAIDPWRVRNVVAWCRPNPPVGALGDKFRPATSFMTIGCVSPKRYFDLDAVRTALTEPDREFTKLKGSSRPGGFKGPGEGIVQNANGAPPLDYWEIPTQPYKGSHYATWPEALLEKPIKAMCPQRVCTVCGEPSRRIVGHAECHQSPNAHDSGRRGDVSKREWASGVPEGKGAHWTDCGHDSWRNGVILDPFGGSGTTAAVAQGHGRDCILVDIDARNADLARDRVGMFLEVTS